MNRKVLLFGLVSLFLVSCQEKGTSSYSGDSSSEEVITDHSISEYLLSEKINLINLNGATTYDLLKGDRYISLYTEDAKGPLYYSLISMVDGKEVFLNNNIVDFTKIEKAYYVVGIYQEVNGKKTPIYAYYADFYDESYYLAHPNNYNKGKLIIEDFGVSTNIPK